VSALPTDREIVLGQLKVDDRANEISFLNRSTEWEEFSSIGIVKSTVTRDQKVTLENRY
jgi:hypothetical protein